MNQTTREMLARVAKEYGTPCYVYLGDDVRERFALLARAFEKRFTISYAVKANPNPAILQIVQEEGARLDVSSIGEVEHSLKAGFEPGALSFSGPAKRIEELSRAVDLGVGEFICESRYELESLNGIARTKQKMVNVLLRINPQAMPKKFALNMAGKPCQFGIDEEVADELVAELQGFEHIVPRGFHIYSGTNSLSSEAISENFGIYINIFSRLARIMTLPPQRLIFGAGFGIPYFHSDKPLNLADLSCRINSQIDEFRSKREFQRTELVLEMGRWLVGPCGYLLTSVVNAKDSRGARIRMCDAGFNNHLAACGMMGSVIRRNWQFWRVTAGDCEPRQKYQLVGPLCTTIDTLASDIELPPVGIGDVLAIGSSGAYGVTASPVRFISHPEPREIIVEGKSGEAIRAISTS